MRILHLEDDLRDAELVREMLLLEGIACDIVRVDTRTAFVDALEKGNFELIFADYSLPAFDGISALITQNLGQGNYRVEGMEFQMTGWWVVNFHITANGQSDILQFNLILK